MLERDPASFAMREISLALQLCSTKFASSVIANKQLVFRFIHTMEPHFAFGARFGLALLGAPYRRRVADKPHPPRSPFVFSA